MADPNPLNLYNPYFEQIIHHKHKLQTSNKYQSLLESKQLIIQMQRKQKQKYQKQCQALKIQMEVLISQHQSETERLIEMKQVEIVKYKAQIAQCKSIIAKLKEGNREDKELRRDNERKSRQLQQYLDEFKERDEEITKLKDQKQRAWMELNQIKKQHKHEHVRDIKDQQQKQKLQLNNQELTHKLKLLKQQLNQQIEVKQRKAAKLDQLSHQYSNIKDEYQMKIRQKDQASKQLQYRNIQLERELALARKDVEYLNRQIQTAKQRQPRSQPNQKRFIQISKRLKQQQDPQEEESSIVNEDSNNYKSREKRGVSVSRDNVRIRQRIKDVKNIPLRVSPDHHCLCVRSEKYKNKLKEANDKIVELLAEKCRRGIEMSFQTKTSKRYGNTTFYL